MNQKPNLRYSFDLQLKLNRTDKFIKLCLTKQIYFLDEFPYQPENQYAKTVLQLIFYSGFCGQLRGYQIFGPL